MSKKTTQTSTTDKPVKTAVLYLRVSSKRQMDTAADIDPEGNSIDTQRKICREKARQMGVVILEEYVEPGNSAQTIAKRPVFQDMMKRIKQERDVDHVIIYQRSRAFRNYIDAGNTKQELEKIGVNLVSAKEDFGKGLNAEVMEAMTDVFNWWTVRQSGEDIKLKMANKVRNGGTPSRAKVGYLNVGKNIDGRKINTIEVDSERSRFIVMAFELFATGEESLTSLQAKLTTAGFRMPKWGKSTSGIVSEEKLRNLLRDRYYLGFVHLDGIEYQGNHTPLVTPELFDRVQRVLVVRGENKVRHREHNHYLKGLLWCARCKNRLIVQRAQGRHGGEYYYFFCRGRQLKICDLPFIPLEALEDAVERYYGHAVSLPADFRADIATGLEAATTAAMGLSDEMRDKLTKRLATLDKKESYFLDLAAEEGWPKGQLRAKLETLRAERSEITNTLDTSTQRLDQGQRIFRDVLALLEEPAALYKRSGEHVRVILNGVFFGRLYVDGQKITDHDSREPFGALVEAYRVWVEHKDEHERRSYQRRAGNVRTSKSAASPGGYGTDLQSSTSRSTASYEVRGWSKTVMVEPRGFEPLTFCLPDRCSTS